MVLYMLRRALFALFLCQAANAQDSRALLFVEKSTDMESVVQGRNFTIKYTIFNAGGGDATKVAIKDSSFISPDFEMLDGPIEASFESIPAGGEVSFQTTVLSLTNGVFIIPGGEFQYIHSGNQVAYGISSALGVTEILTHKEYTRKTSKYFTEWATFGFGFSIPTALPLLLYINQKRKNENAYLGKL